MKILLQNARILTMKDNEPIFTGSLVVEGNKISHIGHKVPKGSFDQIIECNGNVIMPGFKNAHAHSAMTFTRSIADDLELHDWLFDCIFPMEAKLEAKDQYILSKLAILEYLSSGITACFDMYYNPEEMAQASIDTGFRTVLLGTVTKYRESVQEMKKAYKKINGKNPLVTYQLGFHAEYTATEEILKELAKAAHELKCPIYTHNSETPVEVDGCKERHNGLTPTEYMEKLGLFDFGGGGFHCVAFSDHDIEIFKKHNLSVVTCPGSNSKLASGIAPVEKYLKSGLNIAIGTDGPGSNNALDFFWEMRLVAVLQKLLNKDPKSMDAYQVLKAATVGGAKAMNLLDADVLAVGKLADIIMIDMNRPNMQPVNNIEKNIVYSGSKDDIKMTMVDGKILYMDGKFNINEPIEEIYQEAQKVTDRLKAK
ncbi:MAG: amidohydrolase [Erysipelotrichaceae bacterium]|nr:amidohydrolase [Erysipelotrichaceae bacterium]